MPDLLESWNTLTVRATLETTARLCRMDAASAAARANELIARMDAASAAAQPTCVLSRGQKQRLSLARTLVHDPVVLLLDEPASGLDPQTHVDLRQLMRRVASEGKTVLISSHELAELDKMADGACTCTMVSLPAQRVSLAPDPRRGAGASRRWTARRWSPRFSPQGWILPRSMAIGIPAPSPCPLALRSTRMGEPPAVRPEIPRSLKCRDSTISGKCWRPTPTCCSRRSYQLRPRRHCDRPVRHRHGGRTHRADRTASHHSLRRVRGVCRKRVYRRWPFFHCSKGD